MSKYRAVKTVVDGITFDSKKEANRYLQLKQLQQNGEIKDLELQVKFPLIQSNTYIENGKKRTMRGCSYIADFRYVDKSGEIVVEDVKGVKTEVYKLKKKLMLDKYNILIREV